MKVYVAQGWRWLLAAALSFCLCGCEDDDDESSTGEPPIDEEVQKAYDNESTTVFTGRVISPLGTGLPGVAVTWAPEQYVDTVGKSYNTDMTVGVVPAATDSNGFFAVVVQWDRDFGYGAIYGRLRLSRPGYASIETGGIGPVTANSFSVGELYPGWMP